MILNFFEDKLIKIICSLFVLICKCMMILLIKLNIVILMFSKYKYLIFEEGDYMIKCIFLLCDYRYFVVI